MKDKNCTTKNTNRKAKVIQFRLTKDFDNEFFKYSKKLKLSKSDTVRRVLESELVIDRVIRDFKKELSLNTKEIEALRNANIRYNNLIYKCDQAINEMNKYKQILLNRRTDIIKINNKYIDDLKYNGLVKGDS